MYWHFLKIYIQCDYLKKGKENKNEWKKQNSKIFRKRIKSVDKCYDESLTDVGGAKIIIEEVINKRNCLLVQKYCYEEILKFVKGK